MAGLALGIASLGWSWENMIAAHGVAQWVGAAIASVLLIVLAFKFYGTVTCYAKIWRIR